MTTAEKIKMLRKREHMTQTELGEKLGVKKNAVSKWECGRVDDIPASKIKMLSVLFSVPVSYLVDEDPKDTRADTTKLFSLLSDENKEFVLKQIRLLLQQQADEE